MTDFGVDFKIKEMFFDRAKVQAAADKSEQRALSKAGAYIRTAARSSIRKRKRVSNPGEPPSSHTADKVVTIRNILFGYDAQRHSVVIGPVLLHSRPSGTHVASKTVPAILEFGGDVTITTHQRGSKQPGAKKVTYAARPFMGPALVKEADKFPQFFANTVSG